MNLDVVPEYLPVIAAQLGISGADLMQMLGSAASCAVPASPALDYVSQLIPPAFGDQAGLFFPCTANGVTQGLDGAVTLPVVGGAYSGSDVMGSGEVLATAVFGK